MEEGNDGDVIVLLTARRVDIGYSVTINESLRTSCSTIQTYDHLARFVDLCQVFVQLSISVSRDKIGYNKV